MPKLLFTAR